MSWDRFIQCLFAAAVIDFMARAERRPYASEELELQMNAGGQFLDDLGFTFEDEVG